MAISAIAEGCAKFMEQELEKLMSLVLGYLADSHPRVRWAAANCVGQLSTDFAVGVVALDLVSVRGRGRFAGCGELT